MSKLILTTEQTLQIKDIFKNTELMIDVDIEYFLTNEQIESVDCIENILNDNDCFSVEIMYYNRAMEFLMKHDNSLKESLNIASDLCFDASSLSSELLASLLASQMIREEFHEYYTELKSLIEEFKNNTEDQENQDNEQ
jgi:hypothetical protein